MTIAEMKAALRAAGGDPKLDEYDRTLMEEDEAELEKELAPLEALLKRIEQ